MTRKKNISEASKSLESNPMRMAFALGAAWADNNPREESDLIIDLIHQRSVAFDYGRDQSDMLKIAEEALKTINGKCPIEFAITYAREALNKIEEIRSTQE